MYIGSRDGADRALGIRIFVLARGSLGAPGSVGSRCWSELHFCGSRCKKGPTEHLHDVGHSSKIWGQNFMN